MGNGTAIVTHDAFQSRMVEAEALVKSGYLPQAIKTPQQAVAIITMGRELGIGTWAALNGINVIQGKPTVSPQLKLGLINKSGELEDMSITDDGNACTVMMKRKGRSPHTETFSMQDAAAMGLATNDNWKRQAPTMRKWRAVDACCRVLFSDITLGFYSPEELNPDVTIDYETGEITDVTPEPQNGNGQPVADIQEYARPAEGENDKPMQAVEETTTLPFPPNRKLDQFTAKDWTAFWPFIQKHLALNKATTNRIVHDALGVDSAKKSGLTFSEALTAIDERLVAEMNSATENG